MTMAGETPVTIIGNLVEDPMLRFTPSGAAVANFTVASTPRTFNRDTNEWQDSDTLFMRCSIWREAAENVVESLTKGDRVIVTGSLTQREFEDREGNKRTVVELKAEEIGPSLKWATAQPRRANQRVDAVRQQTSRAQSSPDPWANSAQNNNAEPPF